MYVYVGTLDTLKSAAIEKVKHRRVSRHALLASRPAKMPAGAADVCKKGALLGCFLKTRPNNAPFFEHSIAACSKESEHF